jgi:hypothetical protein
MEGESMIETVLIVGIIWSVTCLVFLWINYRLHQDLVPNGDRRELAPQIFVETEDRQRAT